MYKCAWCDAEGADCPSGGDDIICLACFKHASRPQEEGESLEDYYGRHPNYHWDCTDGRWIMISYANDEEDPEDVDEEFDAKYPNCSCMRCEKPLKSHSVVMCGGGGGACETWYCEECYEDGTHDCPVCCE